jgi:hypothetical protein
MATALKMDPVGMDAARFGHRQQEQVELFG